MKAIALACAAIMFGSLPAAADDVFLTTQEPTQYMAKDRLLGANVAMSDGKIAGHIEDLIIGGDERIDGVVIGVGGLLGIAEKKVGIALTALKLEVTDGKMNVTLPVTKEELIAAPVYKRINPPKSILQRAVDRGRELRDKSKDVYDAAKVKAAPVLEKAKEATAAALVKAKDGAGPAFARAQEKANQVIENAKGNPATEAKN